MGTPERGGGGARTTRRWSWWRRARTASCSPSADPGRPGGGDRAGARRRARAARGHGGLVRAQRRAALAAGPRSTGWWPPTGAGRDSRAPRAAPGKGRPWSPGSARWRTRVSTRLRAERGRGAARSASSPASRTKASASASTSPTGTTTPASPTASALPGPVRDHHRPAARHRLEHREREALALGGQHDQVGGGEQGSGSLRKPSGRTAAPARAGHLLGQRAFAGEQEHDRARRAPPPAPPPPRRRAGACDPRAGPGRAPATWSSASPSAARAARRSPGSSSGGAECRSPPCAAAPPGSSASRSSHSGRELHTTAAAARSTDAHPRAGRARPRGPRPGAADGGRGCPPRPGGDAARAATIIAAASPITWSTSAGHGAPAQASPPGRDRRHGAQRLPRPAQVDALVLELRRAGRAGRSAPRLRRPRGEGCGGGGASGRQASRSAGGHPAARYARGP